MAGSSIASAGGRSWAGRISVRLAECLFTVLVPSDCRICGEPLIKVSRLPVCQQCLDAMLPLTGVLCAVCGERIFSSYAVSDPEGVPRCGLCRRIEPAFARAAAYGSYEGGLRELIHLLKYNGIRPAANVLGRMLAEAITELAPDFPSGSIAVVPVPLYRAKLHEREFNHAELIARAAVKLFPEPGRLQLWAGALVRKRETPSQTGLTRHQRRENVRGAFAVAQLASVKGREVLVVDDVYTTGATVSECARVLRRAGSTKVWVATVARTLKLSEQKIERHFSGNDTAEEDTVPEITLAKAAGS